MQLYRQGMREGSEQAAVEEAKQVLEIARPITPIDTGALRRSGRVVGPVRRNQYLTLVTVSFGGPAPGAGTVGRSGRIAPGFVDYAVYVHEDPEARHAPPTQWKFLETAWRRRQRGMAARIARRAAAAARRTAGAR
jgi:hypothetical protein